MVARRMSADDLKAVHDHAMRTIQDPAVNTAGYRWAAIALCLLDELGARHAA